MTRLSARVTLSALTLFALALRLFRLDFRSIWLDEAYSLRLAAADWRGIVHGATMDIHPPLFHLLLGGWIRLFGTGEFAARSLSALLGALLVPAVFKLAEALAGRRAAWWSAGLIAVSPYFLELSRSARMGSLLALTAVLSVYFFVHFLKGRSLWFALGWVLSTLAALYTHYFAFLVLFAQSFFIFMGLKQLHLSRTVRHRWLYLQLLLLAGFAPWLPSLWTHLQKGGPSWRGPGASWVEPLHSGYVFFLGTACWTATDKAVALAGLALAAGLLAWKLRPEFSRVCGLMAPRDWGLVLTLLGLPLVLALLYSWSRLNVFDNRYLSLSAALALVTLGAGLSLLPRREAVAAGLLILMAFAVPVRNQYFVYGYYDNWRRAAAIVVQAAAPSDGVAVYPPWNETPLQYYLQGRFPVRGLPGTYDPITGETRDYFYIDRQTVHHLQSLFTSPARVWLVLVNDGETQAVLRGWFTEAYRLRREERLGSIWLGLYEPREKPKDL